jgi:hypothetical protein
MAPVEGTRLAIPAMARSAVAATKTGATAPHHQIRQGF